MLQMKVIDQASPHWKDSQAIISDTYEKVFNANITSSHNNFIVCCKSTLVNEQIVDETLACVGYRSGSEGTLFSEHYLDAPIEEILSKREGRTIAREAIFECGNLASRSAGAGSELVKAVPLLTWCLGAEFVLITATKSLRFILERCQIDFTVLCDAKPDSIKGKDQQNWGEYYKTDPKCVVVNVINSRNNNTKTAKKYLFDKSNLAIAVRKEA